MTLTVMKVFYKKQKLTIITYRNYKHFSNEMFMADVENRISQVTSENNDLEFDLFKEAIQSYSSIKQQYVRANQATFINKTIKKSLKGHYLEINFLNTNSDIDRKVHNKQSNLCGSLIRQEKKNFNPLNANPEKWSNTLKQIVGNF